MIHNDQISLQNNEIFFEYLLVFSSDDYSILSRIQVKKNAASGEDAASE